jgi:hypothetical protein
MTSFHRRSLVLALSTALALTLEGTPAGSFTIDPSTVFTIPTLSRPSYLLSFRDPTFGSTIARVSNDAGTSTLPLVGGQWGKDARQVYSKQQPWSSDGALLSLQNRNGGTPSVVLLDGYTFLPRFALCSSYPRYDYRWHPSPAHAHEQINVDPTGRELMWFDVMKCRKTRSWTLPIAVDYGIGSGEGNPSQAGRFVALASANRIFVVDMDPQPPFAPYPNVRIGPAYTLEACSLSVSDPTSCRVGNVSISPSGKYVDVKYAVPDSTNDAHRILEVDPYSLTLRPHRMADESLRCGSFAARPNGWIFPLKHADMALDPFDGNEDVIVGGRSCPGSSIGRVVKVRLRDGKVTALTNPASEASVSHVSTRNLRRPGWAYVTYFVGAGKRFSGEIVAVKLDGSGTVERLAHHHTASSGCYRCEAHAVPSPDGTLVMFASNWAANCGPDCGPADEIKAYVIRNGLTPTFAAASGTVDPSADEGAEAAESAGGDFEMGPESGDALGDPSGGDLGPGGADVSFALESVFPNPAVSSVGIAYALPTSEPASLQIVDVAGRARMRVDLGASAGRGQVQLEREGGLPPGIYWVRLTQGARTATKQVVFVR